MNWRPTDYRCAIDPHWIDYNGHLRDAYYTLVFSQAVDALMDEVGLDEAYRARSGCTLFTLETHLHYLREIKASDEISVRARALGVDAKRLHLALALHCPRLAEPAAVGEFMLLHVQQAADAEERGVPTRRPAATGALAGRRSAAAVLGTRLAPDGTAAALSAPPPQATHEPTRPATPARPAHRRTDRIRRVDRRGRRRRTNARAIPAKSGACTRRAHRSRARGISARSTTCRPAPTLRSSRHPITRCRRSRRRSPGAVRAASCASAPALRKPPRPTACASARSSSRRRVSCRSWARTATAWSISSTGSRCGRTRSWVSHPSAASR